MWLKGICACYVWFNIGAASSFIFSLFFFFAIIMIYPCVHSFVVSHTLARLYFTYYISFSDGFTCFYIIVNIHTYIHTFDKRRYRRNYIFKIRGWMNVMFISRTEGLLEYMYVSIYLHLLTYRKMWSPWMNKR